MKVYLGDGCYAELANDVLVLTTSNGLEDTNRIVLEPEVLVALEFALERLTPARARVAVLEAECEKLRQVARDGSGRSGGAVDGDEAGATCDSKACTRPPAGWTCTRDEGHEGPCAVWASR